MSKCSSSTQKTAPRAVADDARVVVVGFRKGLCAALDRRGLRFALWNPTQRPGARALESYIAPIEDTEQSVRAAAEHLAPSGVYTHVLAGTEAAVVPAARLRRMLETRRSPVSRVLRCHDKLEMKRHLERQGIPMTAFRGPRDQSSEERLLAELGSPVVVKMRTSSGGRGIVFARDAKTLRSIPRAGRFYEAFVDAEEASVESFVHEGRIQFINITRYLTKGRVNLVPASLATELEAELLDLNLRVIEALGIGWGMTHLEAFLTSQGALFGEIALRPPGGYIMELLDLAYDGDAWDAFVSVELGEAPGFPKTARSSCAVVVLHPGAGTVRAVRGLEAVRKHPAVVDARVRVRAGNRISTRVGLGQDVGRVLLRAGDASAITAAIDFVERELVIQI